MKVDCIHAVLGLFVLVGGGEVDMLPLFFEHLQRFENETGIVMAELNSQKCGFRGRGCHIFCILSQFSASSASKPRYLSIGISEIGQRKEKVALPVGARVGLQK